MSDSIHQFCSFGIPELFRVQEKFYDNPTKIAEFVEEGFAPFIKGALGYFGETFTRIDDTLRQSRQRRAEWDVVRTDDASILCKVGMIHYRKTLFINKKTGERTYLVDRVLGIEEHERMTEDAKAAALEEAAESCYRKGGDSVSLTEGISKQAVKNLIHGLQFPPEQKRRGRKKKVEYLYIDADEDHVALQYDVRKGDLGRNHHRCVMPRLVYVYEGVEPEYDGSGRHHLVNPHYFGGLYDGAIKDLWEEVDRYIRNHYDVDSIKKIYIHGDGAHWIRSGVNFIPGSEFVLDRFHLHKYIISATSQLKDSAQDARSMIYRAIHHKSRSEVREVFARIYASTEEESKKYAVQVSADYILGNWAGIMASLKDREHQTGCSAEGHVSHIFADRMSSRPLGWSRTGVDRMTRLRVYKKNGGSMLDLIRYQKQALPVAAGAEELSSRYGLRSILASEKSRYGDVGKYYEVYRASFVSCDSRKSASIRWHEWFG